MKRAVWALIVAAPLVVVLASGFGHDPNAIHSPLLGRPAPGLALRTLNGQYFSPSRLQGKPAVVNFWASWCVDCKTEQPALLAAYRTFAPRGVVFVGVDYDDTAADARAFARKERMLWPTLSDPAERAALSYGVYGVPETFLIDRRGVIRFKFIGPVSATTFQHDIATLLQEPA